MASFYGIPCFPPQRFATGRLGSQWTAAPRTIYVDEVAGPVCLGNVAPEGLEACAAADETNCYFQMALGRSSQYQGGDGVPGTYRYQDAAAMLANDVRFYDTRRRPALYAGPVDGSIGATDPRTVRGVHVGALPYHFQDMTGQYNEKLLSRHAGAAQAVKYTNINTAHGFAFNPTVPDLTPPLL